MNFVKNNVRRVREQGIGKQSSKQNTSRAEKKSRFRRLLGFESNGVADDVTAPLTALRRDSFGEADGGNSTWLSDDDVSLTATARGDFRFKYELRHLR